MADKKYFTLEEVNQMVPQLEQVFHRVFQIAYQMDDAIENLNDAGFYFEDENDIDRLYETFDIDTQSEVVDDLLDLKMFSETLEEEVDALHAQGCLVKDLRKGIVDWYALNNQQEIFLCWHYGEKEIQYWHDLNGGYKNRRPIQELRSTEFVT